jgi:hypothetical protein
VGFMHCCLSGHHYGSYPGICTMLQIQFGNHVHKCCGSLGTSTVHAAYDGIVSAERGSVSPGTDCAWHLCMLAGTSITKHYHKHDNANAFANQVTIINPCRPTSHQYRITSQIQDHYYCFIQADSTPLTVPCPKYTMIFDRLWEAFS